MSPSRILVPLALVGLLLIACGGSDETEGGDTPAAGKGGKAGKGGSSGKSGSSGKAGAGGSTAGTGGAGGSGPAAGSGGVGGSTAGAGGAKAGSGGNAAGSGGATAGSGPVAGSGPAAGSGPGGPCSSGAQCDDGNECTNDSCSGGKCLNSPKNPPETCAGGSKVCKAGACTDLGCGDGIKNGSEECDDGNQVETDGCTSSCKLSVCGDGFIQAGEDCDDKNADESDGCTSKCKKPGTNDGKIFDPGGEGSTGVKLDDKGNVIIDPATAVAKVSKPIIWVANSGEGTISKIDTQTLQEIGRYCTGPGCNQDPSRTTVGLSGDVVSANRGGTSATRISTDEINCVDRNGNGKIDTWKGPGPVPPEFQWQAGQPDSPDECVIWHTNLSAYGSLARAAGFDAEIGEKGELSTYVYIGIYSGSKLLRLNAATGAVVKDIPVPGNPYGLVVDKNGSVWIQSGGSLVKVDVKNGDAVSEHPAQCMYGITADPQGRIYTCGGNCLRRYDPTTGENVQANLEGGAWCGGVAIDQNGHAWAGEPTGTRFDTNTMQVIGTAQAGGHGWAIDYDGFPWSIPISGNNQAFKIDPNAGSPYSYQTATPGIGTYTYSDMTGFQLVNSASKGGIFRKTFAGCGPDTEFTSLDLSLLAPAQTTTVVSVRTAATVADLANAPWKTVASMPPSTSPIPLSGIKGGVIQVEVAMKAKDLNTTPILSTLGVSWNTNTCLKE